MLLSACAVSYGQQITTPDAQPLNLRSDANNVNLFVGLATATANGGGANTFLGYQAGQATTSSTQNTFVGHQSGFGNLGTGNTFMGYQAGRNNQSGGYNVFIGLSAGLNNTAGLGNLFLGQQAGVNNTTGNYNLFMGNSSGSATNTGTGNTAIGDGSGLHNTSGQRNTFIGQYAGLNLQTGTDNVFIGFGAKAGTNNPTNVTNSVAIGANAVVSQDNSIVFGTSASKVGIGTSTPAAKLEVVSGTAGVSGLRLTNIGTTATALNQTKFLTVNATGDVVLGSPNSSGRIGADEEGVWKTDGDNIQNTNAGGVVIGSGVARTPVGYKLYVAGGVLTEKVKVAVKSRNEWSDKVFENGYRLRGLSEVERYIKSEKHLPGVPSAQEVVTSGVDVGQMQATLLEKVEELTLYVIELKKQNDDLRKKSNQLEQRVNKLQTKSHK